MSVLTVSNAFSVNTDLVNFTNLLNGVKYTATSSSYLVDYANQVQDLFIGSGFGYNSSQYPISGTITSFSESINGINIYTLTGLNVSVPTFLSFVYTSNNLGAEQYFLSANDTMIGGLAGDLLRSYAGDDYISGGEGNDSLDGGDGNDTIFGDNGNDIILGGAGGGDNYTDGGDYLWGGDGNDTINGGGGFDNINGNKGNDVAYGGDGNDWVVGGQDNDLLYGDNGNDIVYGNLGNDTLYGGNGDDWVRGGQGNDVLYGDAGNDFMSGDKGDDTIYGGAGADRFNMVAGCALDKVMDFKASEGDYVTIEGNPTAYRWFVGSDCYISASPQGSGSADVMILVGVSSDTLLGSHWYIAS